MSRVLITGSTEGLGLMAARLLADDGHSVTLHARSAARAEDARAALPAARSVLVGDLSSIAGMRQVAGQANAGGPYDAVIHNAGVGYREPRPIRTDDGDARVTGGYFYHQKPRTPHPAARDPEVQDQLLRYCTTLTGVTL